MSAAAASGAVTRAPCEAAAPGTDSGRPRSAGGLHREGKHLHTRVGINSTCVHICSEAGPPPWASLMLTHLLLLTFVSWNPTN